MAKATTTTKIIIESVNLELTVPEARWLKKKLGTETSNESLTSIKLSKL